ncbi:MAG TPA: hypothetical protein VLH79_05485 [Chthonomonadales bacterium]|nr:hypothetical protein [Chthonomonadales bacterium]
MLTLPPDISDAERAVHAYKHELLVRVMAHIVRVALRQPELSANDIPADLVEKTHRQGVVSNAWNALAALEIIERAPLAFSDPARGIFGGRTMNAHPDAKGRWVAVYRLRSRSAALTWLQRNSLADAPALQSANCHLQPDLLP